MIQISPGLLFFCQSSSRSLSYYIRPQDLKKHHAIFLQYDQKLHILCISDRPFHTVLPSQRLSLPFPFLALRIDTWSPTPSYTRLLISKLFFCIPAISSPTRACACIHPHDKIHKQDCISISVFTQELRVYIIHGKNQSYISWLLGNKRKGVSIDEDIRNHGLDNIQ